MTRRGNDDARFAEFLAMDHEALAARARLLNARYVQALKRAAAANEARVRAETALRREEFQHSRRQYALHADAKQQRMEHAEHALDLISTIVNNGPKRVGAWFRFIDDTPEDPSA